MQNCSESFCHLARARMEAFGELPLPAQQSLHKCFPNVLSLAPSELTPTCLGSYLTHPTRARTKAFRKIVIYPGPPQQHSHPSTCIIIMIWRVQNTQMLFVCGICLQLMCLHNYPGSGLLCSEALTLFGSSHLLH